VGPIVTALRRKATYRGYAREALSLAQCVARYPLGFFDGGVRAGTPCGDTNLDTPLLLLHGFGHNSSGWFLLKHRLSLAGFTSVHTWNYDPFRHDVPELADMLRDRVELVRGVSGAPRINVVGHSLGGVLLRWYVQELGGDATVANAITVASPHRGTRLASFVPGRTGRIASELAPGSWLMRRLEHGARRSPVRWTAFYSNLDLFVQPNSSAMITEPELAATNVLVKDVGHLSIMLSSRVANGIVDAVTAPGLSVAS
jgi:triacylglycerol esterase/lipase EstA (alpha/beta hydrolase family)